MTTPDREHKTYVIDFTAVAREFNSLSTQMNFITEDLNDHVRDAMVFLEYPKTENEIYTTSIEMYEYDPDDESTDNMDNESRRRIRTMVMCRLSEIIERESLRDSTGRLLYTDFILESSERTLIFK